MASGKTVYTKSRNPEDDFTRELNRAVQSVRKNEKWRLGYMTLQMNYQDKYEQGVKHGMELGMELGIERGVERGIEQGRILSVPEFLSNGGDENLAKKLLKATDEELSQAKELLVNP